jgi:hypothetical protein
MQMSRGKSLRSMSVRDFVGTCLDPYPETEAEKNQELQSWPTFWFSKAAVELFDRTSF